MTAMSEKINTYLDKMFIPDSCTGNVVVVYPSRRIVRDARRLLIDIGFSRARGNSDDVDIYDYINYVTLMAKENNVSDIMAVIPDSWDYNKYVMNLVRFRKIIKQRVSQDSIVGKIRWLIVTHYGNVDAFINQYIAYYQSLRDIITLGFGIPLRKMTVMVYHKPRTVTCAKKPTICETVARYVIKKIRNADENAYIHGLGIRKKLLSLLNIIDSADTASYRLAVNSELRKRDYGKGMYMIGENDDACEWFNAWLGDYA